MFTAIDKTTAIVQVGQYVSSILYDRGMGIVVAIHGEQRPESVRQLGGGVGVIGGRASFDVVFEGGQQSIQLPEGILRGVQWQIYGEVASAQDIAQAVANAEAKRIADAKAADEERQAFAAAVEAIKSAPEYAHLEQLDGGRYGGKACAGNVRKDLKKHFPGVKFSVRSDATEVRVRWTDGPLEKDVEAIVDRYKAGHFDGMTDCYNYTRSAFTEVFGSVRWTWATRDSSDDLIRAAIDLVFARWGDQLSEVARPTVEEYRNGNCWRTRVLVRRWDNLQQVVGAAAGAMRQTKEGYEVDEERLF